MSRDTIKPRASLPLMKPDVGWGEQSEPQQLAEPCWGSQAHPNLRASGLARRQRGASLVMAIFLVTALAALGGLLTQLLVLGSEETLNEWYSAQALYAAESGVEWAARDLRAGGSGSTTDAVVVADRAWVSTAVSSVSAGGRTLFTITSIGSAGGTAGAPRAQRRIVVQFMP